MPGWLTADVELRDGTVWDGTAPFAVLEPSGRGGPDVVALRLAAPVWISRGAAHDLVEALTRGGVRNLDVGDELVRYEARRRDGRGSCGGCSRRATRPVRTRPATLGAHDRHVAAAVDELLPGVEVRRRGFGRRVLVVAGDERRPWTSGAGEAPRPRRRRARARRRRHRHRARDPATVRSDGVGGAHHRDRRRRRHVRRPHDRGVGAERHRHLLPRHQPRVRRCHRRATATDGRPGWSFRLGLGVPPVLPDRRGRRPRVLAQPRHHRGRHAGRLRRDQPRPRRGARGGDVRARAAGWRARTAPVPWQRAHRRIIAEVSRYATTNMREATAEMFKLWWCSSPDGSAGAAGRALRRPDRTGTTPGLRPPTGSSARRRQRLERRAR